MPYTRKSKSAYRAIKQAIIDDRIQRLVQRSVKKAMAKKEAQLRIEMDTRVEAQVAAQVQERIRVEMDVAGLQDQVAEIRSELNNAEMERILQKRNEILVCIWHQFNNDILAQLSEDAGIAAMKMIDVELVKGHWECRKCEDSAELYRNLFLLERAMEDIQDKDYETMATIVKVVMTAWDEKWQHYYLQCWEEERGTGWSRYKQTQLNRLSPPA